MERLSENRNLKILNSKVKMFLSFLLSLNSISQFSRIVVKIRKINDFCPHPLFPNDKNMAHIQLVYFLSV